MRSRYRPFRARQRSSGFSLLEVTVAIAVLSIAIASIIQLYTMNLKSTRKAELYTEAIIYARSAMDTTLSSDKLEEGSNSDTIKDFYKLTTTIAAIGGDEEEEIAKTYEVTVEITWDGGSLTLRARKSIPLETDIEER